MKIGYARVSTEDQRLTLQLEALKQAGCGKVFREKVSGAYRDRPELNRMLDQLRDGDVVTVWKLGRLARSTRNLLEIVEAIRQAGARFQSISEPWADTTTHAGKMIMTIFAGIAEFERDLIRERTGAGRTDALKRGVRFGRPKKMNEEQRELAKRLLKEGKSVREVARTFSIHPATLYRMTQPSIWQNWKVATANADEATVSLCSHLCFSRSLFCCLQRKRRGTARTKRRHCD